jgi:hypothetical protein
MAIPTRRPKHRLACARSGSSPRPQRDWAQARNCAQNAPISTQIGRNLEMRGETVPPKSLVLEPKLVVERAATTQFASRMSSARPRPKGSCLQSTWRAANRRTPPETFLPLSTKAPSGSCSAWGVSAPACLGRNGALPSQSGWNRAQTAATCIDHPARALPVEVLQIRTREQAIGAF